MPKNENEQELTNYVLEQYEIGRHTNFLEDTSGCWRRQIIQEIEDHPASDCWYDACWHGQMICKFKHGPTYDSLGLPTNFSQEDESYAYFTNVFAYSELHNMIMREIRNG